jgi:hypothetical protein
MLAPSSFSISSKASSGVAYSLSLIIQAGTLFSSVVLIIRRYGLFMSIFVLLLTVSAEKEEK